MIELDKKIIKEEWWAGCYRDDYFLHGGMGGDYNDGYMYGLQYEDYVLTTYEDGSQEVAEAALIPMLVKAIQELSAEIETLKSGG